MVPAVVSVASVLHFSVIDVVAQQQCKPHLFVCILGVVGVGCLLIVYHSVHVGGVVCIIRYVSNPNIVCVLGSIGVRHIPGVVAIGGCVLCIPDAAGTASVVALQCVFQQEQQKYENNVKNTDNTTNRKNTNNRKRTTRPAVVDMTTMQIRLRRLTKPTKLTLGTLEKHKQH